MEDEEDGTDTQIIMDTDSADAVGEVPNEEGNFTCTMYFSL